jgi:hypothetical protein
MRLWERSPDVTCGKPWAPEEEALLGTMPDRDVAKRTGHTLNAVWIRRRKLGIAAFREKEPSGTTHERRTGKWTAAISVNGKRRHLGTFISQEDAERA